jgi:hypothetical protein
MSAARGALRVMVLRRWRVRVWLVLAIGLGIGLGQLPLFGVLGFELATVAAAFAAIMGLDVGAALAREVQRQPVQPAHAGRAIAASTLGAVGLALAITLVPAAICAVRGAWTPTCDWWFGIVAYLAMPLATAALAGAFGHAIGILVPRRYLGAAIAQLPIPLLVAAALWRFFTEPPVFFYSPILGYFPGNLYDENIQLTSALAWSRLEQLLWVIALLAAIASRLDAPRLRVQLVHPRPAGHRIGAILLAVLCAGGATAIRLESGTLGYAVDADDIADALGGRIETAHFIIYYANTKEIEADIQLIAEDHEFRYSEVVAQLGMAPEGKLTSFYFADREQKGRLFGAKDVEMAKPWLHSIYLDHRAFPHSSLRHEIAHAVASSFGDPWFGLAAHRILGMPLLVNPGMIEGLAVATDWPGGYDHPTPHEAVRAMVEMGVTPSIDDLLSLRFLTVSSARGYTTAGSFLRFLLETYGAEKFRAVYHNGGDFEAAYGKPREELETEWRAMIAKIVLPADAVEASRERFRAGSVFARPCPHAIAARRERALAVLGSGDRQHAIDLMRHVCSDAPDEPHYQLELGDFLTGGDDAQHAEAKAMWTALSRGGDQVTSTTRAEAFERLAREAAAHGHMDQVRALIGEAVKLPVDAGERRQLDAEAFTLAHDGPANSALRGYFYTSGFPVTPQTFALIATLSEPDLGFGHYLYGLQATATGDWKLAAAELTRAVELGLPGLPFIKNAARRLAIVAYRIGDQVGLAHAIAALNAGDTADHLLAIDWQSRLRFDATSR